MLFQLSYYHALTLTIEDFCFHRVKALVENVHCFRMEKFDDPPSTKKTTTWPSRIFWVIVCLLVAIGLSLGVVIGYFSAPTGVKCPYADSSTGTPTNVIDKIIAANIEENLR